MFQPPLHSKPLRAAWALLLAAGCAYAPARKAALAPPPALPAEIAAYYDYPKPIAPATIQPVRNHPKFREFFVSFPLSVRGFEPTEPTVEFEWFESTQPGRRPAIVFNPILGGDYPLERGICRHLARNGFHVALIHRKTLKISPDHEVARIELLLRQGVIRIRQVVDWMAVQERVDPERIGSYGISMGGIASVMAAAVEPRLKAHMVALAGGSVPDVLMSSRDTLLTKPLGRYLARRGMTREELDRRLREEIRTDPLRLAPYVDPGKLLLLIAVFDRTVGTRNALRLRKALRYPPTVFLPFGHYTAYFSLPYLKFEGVRFFRKTLDR